jgi:membrane protein YqaA with SNARE-associated domain
LVAAHKFLRLDATEVFLILPALLAIAKPSAANSLLRWLRHLGGPGLILLGLIDNSVVPVPGSMDVFVIVLAADQRDLWPYYAFMATLGSVIGGYSTYRLARGGGKGRLGRRLKRSQMEKVHAAFEKWGFLSIAVPAMLPPPLPMVPFLIAAGAAQYSLHKFLGSLFLGRAVRYLILAFLAARYGKQILGYFSQHTHAIVWTAVALVLAGIALAVFRAKFSAARHA